MSLLLKRNVFGNTVNKENVLPKKEAFELLDSWVINSRLKLHMLQVAHLMKCWAKEKLLADEKLQWKWEMAGLLHDADWDQWPETHCKKIVEYLESKKCVP